MKFISKIHINKISITLKFLFILCLATSCMPIFICIFSLKLNEIINALGGSVWLSLPLIAAYLYRPKKIWDIESKLVRMVGLIFALFFFIALHILFYYMVWTSVHSNALGFSTSVIVLFFLPFIAISLMIVGYFIGYIACKFWLIERN